MGPLIIARLVHSPIGADIRDWNNAARSAGIFVPRSRPPLPAWQMPHPCPDEPTMACLAVESVLSEHVVLIIRGARETRSSNVREPPPINLGRAVLHLDAVRCNYICYI